MNKITLLIIGLLFSVSYSFSQNRTGDSKNMWTKTDKNSLQKETKVHRSSKPSDFQLYKLDLERLKRKLSNAPMRGEVLARKSPVKIAFPNASGEFETFAIIETPAMEDELARKMPMIKSYAGQGIDDPSATMRFTVTQFGLHTMTLSGTKRSWFIDPYTEDRQNYIIYSKESLGMDTQSFECLTDERVDLSSLKGDTSPQNATDDNKLRTYRLAQSCTGEYATIFKGSGSTAAQKANVQAQMAITMTRVNGIYERDLAITMIFVANNDDVIYLTANNDPWTNEWNTQTAVTLDNVIGVNNYDIGHNFNTTGGGNAGCLGCVCTSASQTGTHKGRGYTGRADPTGDPFDVDYVAHEMGHQFDGWHTMNTCSRSGNGSTEVEPASGSTIMGYAGICSSNIQNNSDAYFHYVNIRDISANVKTGASSSCDVETNIGNAAPTADAGNDYTIPASTPYMLVGSSTDADGTASHTFTWEQNDTEQAPNGQAPPAAGSATGPMVRSFEGTTNPIRYIPRLTQLTTGGATPWEVLPIGSRSMEFALTVRDNNAAGGQTADDLMTVTTAAAGGPFIVTSQNTATTWEQGSTQTITWDVAGTTAAPINTANVDILLSTDGGLTYPTVLATATPNDGSHTITVPNGETTTARVMVKGNGNIFFNINSTNIDIAGATNPVISYSSPSASTTEGASCYVDIIVPLTVALGPSANATANFSVTGGTATSGADFDIMTPSLMFAAGATASQDFTVRVYNDGLVEGTETAVIDFSIATGGDATAGSNSLTLTINDDDSVPSASTNITLFSDDFSDGDSSDWTGIDNNSEPADDWFLAQESNWTTPFGIYTDYFLVSYSWNNVDYSPDNFITSPAIGIPAGASGINLRFFAGSGSDPNFFSENYEVYISTTTGSVANILAGTRLVDTVVPAVGAAYYDVAIPAAFENQATAQDVYISFRHHDTTGQWLLGIDDVSVTANVDASIRTAVNTGTTNDTLNVSGTGLSYTADDSGEFMLDITNNDTFNYGCTDVSVSRSGTSGQAYNGSTLPNHVMDKTFTITPTNTTTSGDVTTAFYFDATEISGWETATGLTSGDLVALREGTGEIVPLAVSAFGGNTILTGTFTGLSGTYYFGPEDAFRVTVAPKVYLQGAALNPNGSEPTIMRDDLRVDGLIPTVSPFADNLTFNASVLNVTGANAIVDWVQVELRDQNTNTTIIASQSALLQRDGDVVGVDGVSPLVFNYPSADYYVSVRHKSHLGIMSANAILMTAATKTVDFTDGTTATFGTDAQTTFGMPSGILGMWAGDANGDGRLNYSGALSDVPTIRSQVFNDPDNSVFGGPPTATYPSEGYFGTDTDMDGVTVYSGATSDVLYVRNNIFNNPSNSVFGGPPTATYVFIQQLPEGAN